MHALVTGGAGFIGSHIAESLLAAGHTVRVLDDLSSGFRENVPAGADLVEGGIADAAKVGQAMEGVEVVFHQAAHRAVLRSVVDPLATDTANNHGTLTVLKAAADAGVRRLISASSSSVYGGAAEMPTSEAAPTLPRSPYAVTKLTGEHYSRVFTELYGLETVSLRYFNVFGPRQRPDSAYAAVIPLFIAALRSGESPIVHGDGGQSRDFTYISDVVAANLAAATAAPASCQGQAYNVANGESFSLMEMLDVLAELLDVKYTPVHTDPRAGDVYATRGDATAARRNLGWSPAVGFAEGLGLTVDWFTRRN